MEKRMLRESLECEAGRGATLRELEAEIDKRRRLLTDDEREAAWLYAWALVKRQERHVLASAREGHHDYAGGG
jgi:hypothetical protein